MRVTKRWLRRRRGLYPVWLPSYPLPPVSSELVFDPTQRRADEVLHIN